MMLATEDNRPGRRRRWRRFGLRLGGVLLALLCAVAGLELALRLAGASLSPDVPSTTSDRPVVLCIGDSFTVGSGAPQGSSYPNQLPGALEGKLGRPVEVFNAGVAGQNTSQVLHTLDELLRRRRPAVVTLLVGASNSWNLVGYRQFVQGESLLSTALDAVRGSRVFKLALMLSGTGTGAHDDRLAAPSDPALRRLRRRANQHPRDAKAARDLGLAYQRRGQPYRAMRWLWRAVRQNPSDDALYRSIGLTLLDLGRYHEATVWILTALTLEPLGAASLEAMGWLAAERGDHQRARQWFAAGIEADTTNPDAAAALGRFYLDRNDGLEAIKWLNRAAALGQPSGELCHSLARAHLLQKEPEPALRWLVRGIAAAPHDPLNYTALGRLLTRHRPDNADAVVHKLRDDPDVPEAMVELVRRERARAGIDRWIARDLGRIIAACAARGVAVVVQGYPMAKAVNVLLQREASRHGVIYLDHQKAFDRLALERRRELFAADGHCNAKGYALMASTLAEALLPLLRK